MTKHNNKRLGSSLQEGNLHQQDHNRWSRRGFLKTVGLTGSMSMLLGGIPIRALSVSPLAQKLIKSDSERVLVLIQLKGGNDGLNTMIPLYDYGFYQSVRPSIHIPRNEIITLSSEIGIPNYMEAMQSLWQNGSMKVLHGVGYPEQNLSHFRSTDIWSSASDANEIDDTGWLGRWFETEYPDFDTSPPNIPPAVQIGGISSLAFKGTSIQYSVSVANPDQLYEIAQTGQLYNPDDVPPDCYGQELNFMRTVANSTFTYAEAIKEAYDQGSSQVEYDADSNLAQQLAIVGRLIKGNLGTKVYMVSIDGYDTHANQPATHPLLMRQVSEAVKDFFEDLQLGGWDDKVLAMTFSEFGRRIEQNGSDGTDHGSAAPLMLFGPSLEGNGFIGEVPQLQMPDQVGNLQFGIDFRQIYATVLEDWLCIDRTEVDSLMGQSFNKVENLGFSCGATTGIPFNRNKRLDFIVQYNRTQQMLRYKLVLPTSGNVKVDLFNLAGQQIQTLSNQLRIQGEFEQQHPISLAPGMYIIKIEASGIAGSKKILIL